MSFSFNGISKDFIQINYAESRPGIATVERNLLKVGGYPGAYLSESNLGVREITIPINIFHYDYSDLQNKKEELAEWLYHKEAKELVFGDDSDRVYFAVFTGELIFEEHGLFAFGNLEFICPDPYKYGPEQTETLKDIDIVENKGTAPSDPIFELTATKKSTFAMLSLGADEDSEYNLIGIPADVDETIVDDRVTVINERGDTLNTWTTTGTKVDGDKAQVSGELGTDGTGILPLSYGTPKNDTTWYGPALLKEINPIQDFEVEMRMRAESKRPDQVYRIEFYLFDENMNVLGKMGVWDSSTARAQFAGEGRYGPRLGAHINYPISSRNYQHNTSHFHGMARMRRIGQRFEFYIARLRTGDSETGLHYDTITQVFNDALNEYQGRLKYVQIHIGTHEKGRPASVPRINNFKVTELKQATVDQTPYILYPGDVVTFDHKEDDLLINGEPRNDLKNFGGSFFKLPKGFNSVVVTPADTFDTSVKYRNRYL